ncbi:PREDICTED: kallikrein-1 [Chinchilla lanigera]|uniref:Kallikrein 1 n=1 Tax=Chinchilla lanigera TaxID=34839 RepID=A0A8C2V2M2_CHILA|nr:PREDICTED: kallikrein-1 [Chinchilla lanigera]
MRFLVLCLALVLGETGAAPPIQSRVIGGEECLKDSQPWQVALYHFSNVKCGGVLVDPQWVLTAAHCISDEYQVWLGRHSLFDDEDTVQHVHISKSFPHPGFNMSLLEPHPENPDDDYSHDLMLLRLEEPAEITDSVQVVKLPTKDATPGTSCVASGWGSIEPDASLPVYPDELQCVDLKILPKKKCEDAHVSKVTDSMLCAGHLEGGKDTCVGDSGGPLVCDGMLQGITSWGHSPCGLPKTPGIYTNVKQYLEWIEKTKADNP